MTLLTYKKIEYLSKKVSKKCEKGFFIFYFKYNGPYVEKRAEIITNQKGSNKGIFNYCHSCNADMY